MTSIASNKVSQAGDVNLDDVTIITYNGFAQTITPQVIGVEIYEDIFSSFITGKLMVRDSQELTNLLPLVGEEVVRISVSTPSLPEKDAYNGEFFIYKMDDRMKSQERELIYVLHFISKEAIVDLNKKISRAYSGKVSDIARQVITGQDALESKKNFNIEETSNVTKYVSNFWSPTKNLQYLCDTAINGADSPSYIFFENKYGLNFVSLDTLYAGTPLHQRFVWNNYSNETNPLGGSRRDLEKDYQVVMDFQMTNVFNYMERIKSGMYGSEVLYYDILTKQYVHKGFIPDFKETSHLNPYPINSPTIPARTSALMIHENKYYNNFEGYDDVTNIKSIQKRCALLAQAEAYKVTITVLGRTDYSAGQRIYLEVPKSAQITKKDPNYEDKLLSGNYLIAAIGHLITRDKHECTMELIKDSFLMEIK